MITMNNTDTIIPTMTYSAFLRDDVMPELAHQFGFVRGDSIPDLLANSSCPERLEFHPIN